MNFNTSSDLARLTTLQTRALNTRNALDKAATELNTGQKSDRYAATGGNPTRLFSLERALQRNAAFTESITLTELRIDVMQETLGQILTPTETLSVELAKSVGMNDLATSRVHAAMARGAFSDTLAKLNTTVAGQSLFAGTMTDGPAVASSTTILAHLDALAGAAPDAASAIAAIEDYFDAGSGAVPNFHGDGYIGSPDDLSPVDIGEGQRIDYSMRADADELIAVLKAQSLAAVVAGGAFAGSIPDQMGLLGESVQQLMTAKEGLLASRARVGASQYTVEQAKAQRVSERDTYEIARAKIIAVDPLEAASAFQQLQVQLENVFTVTARLANLNFANYIR